jgi:DNA-binding response OmpR family regulator
MSKRILSISYDETLLSTRRLLLEQKGYNVTSALGFTESVEHCRDGSFDLFILGHSIPHKDKLHLIETFRRNCSAPILSLARFGETKVPGDFHASPDEPVRFLEVVGEILAGMKKPATSGG